MPCSRQDFVWSVGLVSEVCQKHRAARVALQRGNTMILQLQALMDWEQVFFFPLSFLSPKPDSITSARIITVT